MKVLIFSMMMFLAGLAAKAEGHEALQVNFNQEIDQGKAGAEDLSKDLATSMDDQTAEKAEVKPNLDQSKKAVANFVDFEIQSGSKNPDAVAGSGQVSPDKAVKQEVNRKYN